MQLQEFNLLAPLFKFDMQHGGLSDKSGRMETVVT